MKMTFAVTRLVAKSESDDAMGQTHSYWESELAAMPSPAVGRIWLHTPEEPPWSNGDTAIVEFTKKER
jgi:hypothetical protein